MRRVKKLLGLCVPVLAVLAIAALAANVAMAQSAGSMYWYQGYGNLGPLAWEGNYWSTTNGGAAGAWVDNSDVYFQGTAGTVYTYSPENYNVYSLNFSSNYILENNSSNTTVTTLNMTGGNVTVANGVNAAIGVWGDSTADQIYLTGTNGLTLNPGGTTTGSLYLDSFRTAGSPTTAQMTGTTTIDGGILGIGGSTSNDLPGSSFIVNNGGSLALCYSGTGKYNAPITINGTGANGLGAIQITKDPTNSGSYTSSQCWNGAISLGSDSLISGYGSVLYVQSTSTAGTTSGSIALNGYHLTLSSGSTTGGIILGYAASSGTYSSNNQNVISGAGTVTYAAYTGSILNPNNYTGPTFFTLPTGGVSSQIKVNNASAFGTGTVTVGGSISLLFQRLDQGTNGGTVTNNFVINGNGYNAADGALCDFANTTVLSGQITLGSNARITSNSTTTGNLIGMTLNGNVDTTASRYVLTLGGPNNMNVNGTIMGSGALQKSDAGTVTLFGTQSYLGTTTVSGGYLVAATPASLPGYTSANMIYANTGGGIGVRVGGSGWQTADLNTFIGNTMWAIGSTLDLDVTNANYTYGNLGGSYGLSVTCANTSGTNTLTLSGSNSYAGPTTVPSGILRITDPTTYPTNSSSVTINNGTIQFDPGAGNTMTISNSTPITFSTSSTNATLRAMNAASGTTTVSNVTNGGSTFYNLITIGGGSDPNASLTISNSLALGSGSGSSGNFDGIRLWPEAIGNTCTVSGVISGTLSSYAANTIVLQTNGAGTVYLTNNNTYNGVTEIMSTSVLNIQNAGALGTTAGSTSVDSGGTLQIQGGITVAGEALNVVGAGVSSLGAVRNMAGSNTWTGTVALSSASISAEPGTSLTISGVMSGNTLTKLGTGTLILSGASNNTYTGLTTVSTGVLNIQKAQALGTTAAGTVVNSGATLQIQGGITTTAEALTLNGGGNNSTNGALESVSGANTYAGLITLGSSARINNDDAVNAFVISNVGTITGTGDLTVGGAGNTSIASVIGNTGAFVKDGTGMVTLNVANTYTGLTTISGGTLAYGVNNAIPTTSAVTVNGGTLALGGYSAAVGSVALNSGAITGNSGTLTSAAGFTQSGGSFLWGGTSDFSVAPTGTGSYNMSGGTFTIGNYDGNGGNFYIGGGNATVGAATFTVSGGTDATVNIEQHTYIGYAAGSAGTVTLSQNATFNARVLYVGDNGSGTVNQSAGLMATTHNVNIGANPGSSGVYNLSGGTLSVAGSGDLTLANNANTTGLFYQTGGVVDTTGANTYGGLWVASYGGTNTYTAETATYHIVDGSVTTLGMLVGSAGGTGIFTQDGGVVTVTTAYTGGSYTPKSDAIPLGNAILGYTASSSGTYNLNGGVLNLDPSFGMLVGYAGTGALHITGGVANVNGAAIFGAGTFTFSGGTVLNAGAVSMPVSLLSGGSGAIFEEDATYTGTISGNMSGNGTLTKTGAGKLTLTGTNNYTGLTTLQAGTMELAASAQAPVLTGAGANIEAGQMIFDYPDVAPTIGNLLTASYNGGLWTGGQFLCSTENTTHGLGWVDNGSNVTVMYTLYGDTDLSGTVNGSDLNTVLSNFNKTGMTWAQGDFNYDGTVNGTDLNTVLSNFNQSVSAVGAVPEPSSLLLLAAGLAGLLAYAWRKRK